jgi:hypothetical protein
MLTLNRSFLNRKYTVANVMKALAWITSIWILQVIVLSNITQRHVTSFIKHVPSVQCEVKLERSMRERDGLNYIFIEFNVPAVASDLN